MTRWRRVALVAVAAAGGLLGGAGLQPGDAVAWDIANCRFDASENPVTCIWTQCQLGIGPCPDIPPAPTPDPSDPPGPSGPPDPTPVDPWDEAGKYLCEKIDRENQLNCQA